ncbi:lytic transglycosylase domain-containing protein [Sphingomonas koreensis]|uniref:lytic transglycosylase domain-containing protein n=1 Tax=Sphingomonas koreensis TaxID=93064 RepID=UPI00082A9A3B|nr:lytic transglycosylase domain-containing protein [Sphingomonas koreensis]PJI87168.1 transglycosylase-like protein with SLT domain [Sphingomonas koreensis]RSU59616.1 lytic transglycosylase domain-containing protein [Sphingomonas koreensis]RSU68770.1 lytic transglycosylase domain-containing protein [Sphingomonas koreensis]
MASLKLAVAALALFAAMPARADPVARWRPYIAEASARFGIPPAWIERVMRAESGGRTMHRGRPTTSRAGAMGLMQLMPGTWAEMRRRLGLGADPHHPRDNILAGTLYLRLMYDRFGYPGLFAAFNAGPARYADHLATGRRLPGETRAYLATVAVGAQSPQEVAAVKTPSRSLFFSLSAASPEPRAACLFVPIGTRDE